MQRSVALFVWIVFDKRKIDDPDEPKLPFRNEPQFLPEMESQVPESVVDCFCGIGAEQNHIAGLSAGDLLDLLLLGLRQELRDRRLPTLRRDPRPRNPPGTERRSERREIVQVFAR